MNSNRWTLEEVKKFAPAALKIKVKKPNSRAAHSFVLLPCPIKGENCKHEKARWIPVRILCFNFKKGLNPGTCRACSNSRIKGYNATARGHQHMKNFTLSQFRMIDAISICQFPGCTFQPTKEESLCSDHIHGVCSHKKFQCCPFCYRGEICEGHNRLVALADAFPESFHSKDTAILWTKRRAFR